MGRNYYESRSFHPEMSYTERLHSPVSETTLVKSTPRPSYTVVSATAAPETTTHKTTTTTTYYAPATYATYSYSSPSSSSSSSSSLSTEKKPLGSGYWSDASDSPASAKKGHYSDYWPSTKSINSVMADYKREHSDELFQELYREELRSMPYGRL